jgi:hypothetical protein
MRCLYLFPIEIIFHFILMFHIIHFLFHPPSYFYASSYFFSSLSCSVSSSCFPPSFSSYLPALPRALSSYSASSFSLHILPFLISLLHSLFLSLPFSLFFSSHCLPHLSPLPFLLFSSFYSYLPSPLATHPDPHKCVFRLF